MDEVVKNYIECKEGVIGYAKTIIGNVKALTGISDVEIITYQLINKPTLSFRIGSGKQLTGKQLKELQLMFGLDEYHINIDEKTGRLHFY